MEEGEGKLARLVLLQANVVANGGTCCIKLRLLERNMLPQVKCMHACFT